MHLGLWGRRSAWFWPQINVLYIYMESPIRIARSGIRATRGALWVHPKALSAAPSSYNVSFGICYEAQRS